MNILSDNSIKKLLNLIKANFFNKSESQAVSTIDIAAVIDEQSSDNEIPTAKSVNDYIIKKVPTKTSELINDVGYLTLSTLPKYDGGVE